MPDRRRSLDELGRLGDEMIDRRIRPTLRPEDDGKFIAVDVDSGDYEIDADDHTAVMRLRERKPAGEIWLGRAGSAAAYRL